MAGNPHPLPPAHFCTMLRSSPSPRNAAPNRPQVWFRCRRRRLCLLAGCTALAIASGSGLFHCDVEGHAQSASTSVATPRQNGSSAPAPAASPQEASLSANADDARKQQVASECADLLKMATELKSEVDKSTKDMLSVTVVRKATAIEQFAHKVRTGSPKG